MIAPADYSTILEKCVLFRSLDQVDRDALASKARLRGYQKAQGLFRAGDPGDSLMAVVSGVVRISLTSMSGREIILADLRAGDIFGEIALLDGLGRSADATALSDVEVLAVSRADVLRFLAERPEACLRLLALVCARLRASDERMTDAVSADLGVRLAKALVRQSSGGSPEAPVPVSLTQTDLAAIVGGSREAVNRLISSWQRSGLVEVADGSIIVRRQAELATVAGLV